MKHRKAIQMIVGVTVGTVLFSAVGSAQPACPIKPIKLTLTGAQLNGLTIELTDGTLMGDPKGSDRAMVWDEPMKLHPPGGPDCAVDPKVGIITAPVFDAGGRVLYVTTYSGSHSILFAVGAQNCKILWESRPFQKGPDLVGQKFVFTGGPPISIGTDCLPTHAGTK
jgi:hypothetical protein